MIIVIIIIILYYTRYSRPMRLINIYIFCQVEHMFISINMFFKNYRRNNENDIVHIAAVDFVK